MSIEVTLKNNVEQCTTKLRPAAIKEFDFNLLLFTENLSTENFLTDNLFTDSQFTDNLF